MGAPPPDWGRFASVVPVALGIMGSHIMPRSLAIICMQKVKKKLGEKSRFIFAVFFHQNTSKVSDFVNSDGSIGKKSIRLQPVFTTKKI